MQKVTSGIDSLTATTTTTTTTTTKPINTLRTNGCNRYNRCNRRYGEFLKPASSKQSLTGIPSYGIILRCTKTNRYLIVQRRDTIEYMEFVRGHVTRDLYPIYFTQMTPEERHRLVTYTFSQLWDDLWVNHTNRFYKYTYQEAKRKFEIIQDEIPTLLKMYPSIVTSPNWGFPKGKLSGIYESPERASIREFEEETRIKLDHRSLLDRPSVTETFHGTNGKLYSTTYLFAEIDHEPPIVHELHNRTRENTISEEIATMKWVTFNEASKYLNERRLQFITNTNTNTNTNNV